MSVWFYSLTCLEDKQTSHTSQTSKSEKRWQVNIYLFCCPYKYLYFIVLTIAIIFLCTCVYVNMNVCV